MSASQTPEKRRRDPNVLVIGGRLTRDVEFRGSFATFGLAVQRVRAIDGERADSTCFFEVNAFGKAAAACARHLETGSTVLITGSIDVEERELRIRGEVVYRDEEGKRPVMMRTPVVRTDYVRFL